MLYRYDEIINSDRIDDFLGFNFMCLMAEYIGSRGDKLDASMMSISRRDIVTTDLQKYYSWLRHLGYLVNGRPVADSFELGSVKERLFDRGKSDCDISIFDTCEYFFKEVDGEYQWGLGIADEQLGSARQEYVHYRNFPKALKAMVAAYIFKRHIGELDCLPLHLVFDRFDTLNAYNFADLLLLKKSMHILLSDVCFDVDEEALEEIDLDYYLLYKRSLGMDRHRQYSVFEKVDILKSCDVSPGDILLLYERDGMNSSNGLGRIVDSSLIRIESIYEEKGTPILKYSTIGLWKTKEEVVEEYLSISEEVRHAYNDLLEFRVPIRQKVDPLYNYGMFDYFLDEDYLLELLEPDDNYLISKIITVNGNTASVEMTEVDAVYWVLNQYEVDFDRDRFKKRYAHGADLLWDQYGSLSDVAVVKS